MSPALIAALPFLGALLPGLAERMGRGASALAAALASALALAGLVGHAPAVLRGEVIIAHFDWVPSLGLSASFRIDGLGLMFAGLILGIGLLIILYARFYLSSKDSMGRFLTYLLLFQGAMVGIVLSENLIMMLVFWELTSLSSFLLIGWWRHLPEGRQGARMALTVTGGGGLALIAGVLILGQIVGSYDLSVILQNKDIIQASPWYQTALVLILIGAFTKSAQFPFHFWLPHAMAAPTPVSAYLHSATMVKAGLFLMARLWPVLAGTPEWTAIVASAGLFTMLLGAKIALFKDDLKAILAFSTVSHLGLITFLLGLGTTAAAMAAMLHILAHASFKAALFMVAGIVDHETHTRDIRRFGGLRRVMPITFALALIATLSMAGVPPLNGFLSKELMLENAAHSHWLTPWLVAALATAGALLSVAYSLRFVAYTFLGAPREDHPQAHDPSPGLWAAPAVLVAIVIASGLLPMAVFGPFVDAAASATTGEAIHAKIKLWHGLGVPALWMSVAAFGAGLLVLGLYPRLRAMWDGFPVPDAKRIFDAVIRALTNTARRVTEGLHDGTLGRASVAMMAVIVGLSAYAFIGAPHSPGTRDLLPLQGGALVGWAILSAAALATAFMHRNRVLALLLTGIVGLLLSAGFAWLSAPDLALTQISVEVVAILLMLLALNFLPSETPRESRPRRRLRDATLAGVTGLGAGWLAWQLMTREAAFPRVSDFHWAQSKPGAGGTNAVNTIIVDFRGFDTYGEITVLGIAALVIFALAVSVLSSRPALDRLATLTGPEDAGDPHPLMLVMGTRFLMPLALMVGIYIFLRGHNLPGGGFVAGLVVSIALLLQYIASGYLWSERRQRFDHQFLIGAGVLTSTLIGVIAWLQGLPFLTSGYMHVHIWPLDDIELTTAAIFDLGVFLCVLGAVMLSLATLSRLAQASRGEAKKDPV